MDITQLSDQDLEALKTGDMSKLSDEGLQILSGTVPKEKGLLATGLDYGLRGLDYAGGLVRGAVAGGIEAGGAVNEMLGYEGVPNLVNFEDVLKGKAPSTSETLDKLGVGEMGSLSGLMPGAYSETGDEWLKLKKGGALDVTGRGAIGLAGDIALDPLTYLSLGSSGLAKMGKAGQYAKAALKPTAELSEAVGKSMYKSGLKRIDQEAMKYGKEPVSDTLMKYGISGNAEKIYSEMDTLADTLVKQQKSILDAADAAGGSANMSQAMRSSQAKIAELRATKDPMLQPVADALEVEVQKYLQLNPREILDPSKAAMYGAEKQKYLQNVSSYRKEMSRYKKQGVSEGQDILPGQMDIGQGSTTTMREVPLQGPDVAMKAEEVVQDPFQYNLFELPKNNLSIKGGMRSTKVQKPQRITREMMEQEPKFGMQQLNIENVSPSEIEKALVELPGVKQAGEGFQTSMLLGPPQKPVRPTMPTIMSEGVTPSQAAKMKTSLYELLPKGAYQEAVHTAQGVSPQFTKGRKEMARGLKEETENAVGRVLGAGEQGKLVDVNRELGQILTSKDKQLAESFKEGNKNAVTSVDALVAGSQMGAANPNWWMLALKKAADVAKMTAPRTTGGKYLNKFGTSGAPASIADILLRQQLIESNRGE